MEEDVSLAQRILRDLRIIFENDPNIIEFDIIPVEEKLCNKSPVIIENHRLAIESWCIKPVYSYTYNQLFQKKFNEIKSDGHSLQEWTRLLLLVNPDFTTAWNVRKQLVLNGFISLEEELEFSKLPLTKVHKSAENFAHRQWLLRLMKSTYNLIEPNIIRAELEICLNAASKHQGNYNAWNHRRWVVLNMFAQSDWAYTCELNTIQSWIECNISDYSGFCYRQFLFMRLKELNYEGYFKLLANEMQMLNCLSCIYQDQESLFLQRRFIIKECGRESDKGFIEKYCNSDGWSKELVRRHLEWLKRFDNHPKAPQICKGSSN